MKESAIMGSDNYYEQAVAKLVAWEMCLLEEYNTTEQHSCTNNAARRQENVTYVRNRATLPKFAGKRRTQQTKQMKDRKVDGVLNAVKWVVLPRNVRYITTRTRVEKRLQCYQCKTLWWHLQVAENMNNGSQTQPALSIYQTTGIILKISQRVRKLCTLEITIPSGLAVMET